MFKKILNSAIQGVFWVLPIAAISFIIYWLFGQINVFIDYLFALFKFDPQKYRIIWMLFALFTLFIILSIIGWIATTRVAFIFETFIKKIPFYTTIRDISNIFNSSKKGKKNVLVVAIKGFTVSGYNIGLMYSLKESIIKDHYTVTLSMSPIPNGGFMFEVHKNDIFVIKDAKFNDNLNYLLSMGTKSLAEILKVEPQAEFITLNDYLLKTNKV